MNTRPTSWTASLKGFFVTEDESFRVIPAVIVVAAILIGTFVFTGYFAESDPGQRTVVTLWHPWGGEAGIDFRKLVDRYNNEIQDEVYIKSLYVPNNLSANQKFFLSVKIESPPDVIFVDGPQVAEWAERGVLQELDAYLEAAGIGEDDYWGPCWRQNHYKGHTYALTYCADPNFAFAWNKAVFREVGLDPERPPRTIDELDRMSRFITKTDPQTNAFVRIGDIPWAVYGGANTLFTWGWAWGGSFYNEETRTITAHHPRVVQALSWLVNRAREFDVYSGERLVTKGVERVSGLQQSFGSGEQNPFYMGRIAMMPIHITVLRDIDKYAPDLDFGLTFLPAPDDGEFQSSWIGGWCVAVPRHALKPADGFDFIRWMCATPEGSQLAASSTGSFPGYKVSPAYEEAERDPRKRVFLEILRETRHQRPVMPAQAYFMGELDESVDDAMRLKLEPEAALRRASERTQKELDKIFHSAPLVAVEADRS